MSDNKQNLVTMTGFDGFYGSVLDPTIYLENDEIEEDFDSAIDLETIKGNNINPETLQQMKKAFTENTWDYFENEEYQNDVAKKWLASFNESINDIEGLEDINFNFIKVDSPMAYNYSTDKIIAEITGFGDKEKQTILKLMDKYKDELRDIIREDWRCRSGFISFVSDNYEFWVDLFKDKPYTKDELENQTLTIWSYVPIILFYLGFLENFGTKGDRDFIDKLNQDATEDNYYTTYFNYNKLLTEFVMEVK